MLIHWALTVTVISSLERAIALISANKIVRLAVLYRIVSREREREREGEHCSLSVVRQSIVAIFAIRELEGNEFRPSFQRSVPFREAIPRLSASARLNDASIQLLGNFDRSYSRDKGGLTCQGDGNRPPVRGNVFPYADFSALRKSRVRGCSATNDG